VGAARRVARCEGGKVAGHVVITSGVYELRRDVAAAQREQYAVQKEAAVLNAVVRAWRA